MKTKSFFSLIAAAFVAVACQPKGPEFTPSFEVNGASLKDGKIAVEAAGANAKLAVASNVSWAVDASEDWVVVTPAKADITDKALKTTEVTVAVSANEAYEPRQATLTLSATDVNLPSIVVTINQDAAVKPETIFQVLDSKLAEVTSLDVEGAAGSASVIVNANVSWTAAADAAWCTIEPANATIAGYEETPTAVTISYEANDGEARSCNVTFTPAEGEPVVVAINQDAADEGPIGVLYEALFGYSSKYYYWSKECYFQYDPQGTWNDGYVDFNAQLVDFASTWEDEQFKLNGYVIPCFWDDTEKVMNVGSYYSFASYTASAEDAENWSSSGVKEGDELDVFLYASDDYIPFDYVQYNDGTHGLVEQTAGMLQAVLATESSLIAYFPAKVSLTAFQEATVAKNSPKFSATKGSMKPVAFEKPISLNGRTVKHAVR